MNGPLRVGSGSNRHPVKSATSRVGDIQLGDIQLSGNSGQIGDNPISKIGDNDRKRRQWAKIHFTMYTATVIEIILVAYACEITTAHNLLLNLRSPCDCGSSCHSRLWYFLSPLDGASVREAHCAQASTAVRRTEAPCVQASTAVRFSARSAQRAGYCLTYGVNDHTRSAENWKCVWYFLRPIDGSRTGWQQ